jgi:multidrug efflux pump subunit AcrB
MSIVVSLIVSLTLTPMMSARLLTPERGNPGVMSRAIERFFDSLVAVYDRGLVVTLRYRQITLTIMILTVCLTMALFVWIPKGFFPQEDTGLIDGISEGSQDISHQSMANRQQAKELLRRLRGRRANLNMTDKPSMTRLAWLFE